VSRSEVMTVKFSLTCTVTMPGAAGPVTVTVAAAPGAGLSSSGCVTGTVVRKSMWNSMTRAFMVLPCQVSFVR
jgi:hypothetical protein